MDIIQEIKARKPVFWKNPALLPAMEALGKSRIKTDDIYDAEKRFKDFAPFLKAAFPETGEGIIESPLKEAFRYAGEVYGSLLEDSSFFIKCDNDLPVAGSIKARGGIYEILKHAEDLILGKGVKEGLKHPGNDYSVFASESYRKFFSRYNIAVGSTGNLGLSIGIMSARLGFNVVIHMSHDAKEWKKNMLKGIGVKVVEYRDSYSKAVEEGRKSCEGDPYSYFVDDENSKQLFLGYSTAALRLKKQLEDRGIEINENRKLNIYLPCGVGGAPGGITFGIKHVFGDNAKCFFAEPVSAPSVLLGFINGSKVNTKDYGIMLDTDADGLAVDSPSELVLDVCRNLVDGIYTVTDKQMYKDLYLIKKFEDVKIEVSAAAGLCGPAAVYRHEYRHEAGDGIYLAWLTGGSFVPETEYSQMHAKGENYL